MSKDFLKDFLAPLNNVLAKPAPLTTQAVLDKITGYKAQLISTSGGAVAFTNQRTIQLQLGQAVQMFRSNTKRKKLQISNNTIFDIQIHTTAFTFNEGSFVEMAPSTIREFENWTGEVWINSNAPATPDAKQLVNGLETAQDV